MEILTIYILFGALISSFFLLTSDLRPWKLFAILCIAWLPFFIIGTMAFSFMDIEKISSKLNI